MSETQTTAPRAIARPVEFDGCSTIHDATGFPLFECDDPASCADGAESINGFPALIAERDRLRKALKECRGALQYFIDSEVIERSSVVNAWAAAVAAESKARAALGEGK